MAPSTMAARHLPSHKCSPVHQLVSSEPGPPEVSAAVQRGTAAMPERWRDVVGCCRCSVLLFDSLSSPVPAVYVVEERRRDDTGESACLTACWTALCCCCLWDMLT